MTSTTLFQIENLVGLLKIREADMNVPALGEFDKFSDRDLAEMLCTLAVQHLDNVALRPGS